MTITHIFFPSTSQANIAGTEQELVGYTPFWDEVCRPLFCSRTPMVTELLFIQCEDLHRALFQIEQSLTPSPARLTP